MSINSANYTVLNDYAVFAVGALTVVGVDTVNEGNWYGFSITPNTFVGGTGTPTPQLDNAPSRVSTATTQLNTLITDIETVAVGLSTHTDIAAGTVFTFSPNVDYFGTGITYGAVELIFDAGSLGGDAQFFITSIAAFTFTNTTFTLRNGARAGNIFWLTKTGGFSVTNSTSIPDVNFPGNIITKTADFSAVGSAASSLLFTGHIFSKGAASFSQSNGLLSITAQDPVVCYAKGTLILTSLGYVPIEDIHVGYNVVTKGQIYNNEFIKEDASLETKPVTWISKFKVQHLNSQSRPICIKKGALGENNPFQDLYVSPGHRVILNGKMVCARDIVNKATICQDNECESVEYYHLECEEHSTIFANGVLSESFLDLDMKYVFEPVPLIQHNDIQCYTMRVK